MKTDESEIGNDHRESKSANDYREEIKRRTDELVAQMNRPGAGEAVDNALFSGSETLRKAYRPDDFDKED